MNKILKVSKINKTNSYHGNYSIDVTIEHKIKRFYIDKIGKLRVDNKKYSVTHTEYFFRKKLVLDYHKKLMNKLKKR